jgi:hypothetical protein
MHIGRTILILLIALSVAVLPTGSGAAIGVKSVDTSHMSSTDRMHHCCPHKDLPSPKALDDCCSSMACPMNSFSFVGESSLMVPPPLVGNVMMSLVSDPVRSQEGGPPFRPPRI